ncbi:MAG: DUF4079 family protein [Deltaproteobacteria bacterium]|nr:DUF4079 family protein [Deltaproteobacteria bacterium]
MLLIHPIIQCSATLLALYVFYLGVQRFRFLHMNQKTVFKWKRHVALGKTALGVWLVGMVSGLTMVYLHWHGFLITGVHGKVALVLLPLVIFGLASGLYMDRNKKKRGVFLFMHGLNNLVVLMLAVGQAISGLWVFNTFVLGG